MNNFIKQSPEYKEILRIFYKNLRKSLDIGDISRRVVLNIENSEIFQSANNVMFYLPIGSEIDLTLLFKKYSKTKQWFVPKCFGKNLGICRYYEGIELSRCNFGVLEPKEVQLVAKNIIELILVPSLSASRVNKHRLGYGKGFYDRFLYDIDHNKCKSIIVCAEKLILDSLPICEHDVSCDFIVTEHSFY